MVVAVTVTRLTLCRQGGRIRPWSSRLVTPPSTCNSCRAFSATTGHKTKQRSIIPATNVPICDLRQEFLSATNTSATTSNSSTAEFSTAAVSSSSSSKLLVDVDNEFLESLGIDRDELLTLAAQRPIPLRLADMYKYGSSKDLEQRLRNAQFLYEELPIRIAQRAVDLLTLPHGLSEAPSVREVAATYLSYLVKLQKCPMPKDQASEDRFTDKLQAMVLDRHSIPVRIAQGVVNWRDEHEKLMKTTAKIGEGSASASSTTEEDLQQQQEELERHFKEMEDALRRFFTARVGLRFLIEHHVLSSGRESTQALRSVTSMLPQGLENEDDDDEEEFLGCIQNNCDVVKETRRVADMVVQQTKEYYGVCPEIDIVDCRQEDSTGKSFTYVPHHLHYMLAELLKNSCRATIQQHERQQNEDSAAGTLKSSEEQLSPIRVVIVTGDEDVTIKIADKGGGIPRSLMTKIWKFGQSIGRPEDESHTAFGKNEVAGAKIGGFGLPLARIYAQYFGGELNLKSMEGYGVDAYLHLPRLGDAGENLPLRVKYSPGELDSMPRRHQMTSRNIHTQPRVESTRWQEASDNSSSQTASKVVKAGAM